MAEVSVLNMEGNEVEKLNLNDSIFGVEINEHLVHLAVVSQLANNRRVHRARRHVQKYAAAEENPGDRKVPVMQDRDLSELRSGQAEELYLLRNQENILRS